MENNGSPGAVDCYYGNPLETPTDWLVDLTPFLPVEWSFVNAKEKDKTVEVSWGTSLEINNERFEIEKSPTGEAESFVKIGTQEPVGDNRGYDTHHNPR